MKRFLRNLFSFHSPLSYALALIVFLLLGLLVWHLPLTREILPMLVTVTPSP